ncbi:MAG TPA: hypothetical protein EYG03_17070 [Planctomycetes bacterium]|nr:hypothetical protein [Fuerstiella sp.]HIK93663.1 hypothetical protein [Planctomycetota bacterium]
MLTKGSTVRESVLEGRREIEKRQKSRIWPITCTMAIPPLSLRTVGTTNLWPGHPDPKLFRTVSLLVNGFFFFIESRQVFGGRESRCEQKESQVPPNCSEWISEKGIGVPAEMGCLIVDFGSFPVEHAA